MPEAEQTSDAQSAHAKLLQVVAGAEKARLGPGIALPLTPAHAQAQFSRPFPLQGIWLRLSTPPDQSLSHSGDVPPSGASLMAAEVRGEVS
jgi:hypothetical protein